MGEVYQSPATGPVHGRRLILIVGMHRSGTSLLTKALHVLGAELGDGFIPSDKFNPKGYWENYRFLQINEELLGAAGMAWDNLGNGEPERVATLADTPFFARARALVRELPFDGKPFALKDPRFSVLIPFWAKVLQAEDISVSYVVAFRNPLSVVDSLCARATLPPERALWLWAIYNIRILAALDRCAPIVVDYDTVIDHPVAQLTRLAAALGLSVDPAIISGFCEEFISPRLRHTRYTLDALKACAACDPLMVKVYEALCLRALDPGESDPVYFNGQVGAWLAELAQVQNLLSLNRRLISENKALERRIFNRAMIWPRVIERLYEIEQRAPGGLRPLLRWVRARLPG